MKRGRTNLMRKRHGPKDLADIDITANPLSINETFIYRIIFYRGPITMKDVVYLLYCGVEGGGPDWGEHSVRQTITRLNLKLLKYGQRIMKPNARRDGLYYVSKATR